MAAVCLIAAAADSRAESNPHPIAIPAIGTQGAATPYPSRIVVNSPGGPNHIGQVAVTLHGVTHPCVDELAVLLVHNDTDGYLLLPTPAAAARWPEPTYASLRAWKMASGSVDQ